MIDKVKNFFTHRRCKKLLKNNKGFSLLEVLVAVTIIGIISSVAIVKFQDYKEGTAFVVAGTSASSIARAYQACVALKQHSQCNSLNRLKVNCDECTDGSTANKFCVNYEKEIGNDTFNLCVAVDNDIITTTAGGDFKLCHKKCTGSFANAGDPCHSVGNNNENVMNPIKRCDIDGDCGTNLSPTSYHCKKNTGSNAGTCNASGECR